MRRIVAVAVAVALPGAVAAAQPGELVRSGGPMDLQVPARILLGTDGAVDIYLRKPDGRQVRLSANVGELSALEPLADGRLRASYRPPATKFPQVAIIAATTNDQALVDWVTIPMYAQPQIRVTSEPNAEVLVRIAGEEFGPVTTDRKGQAQIAVVVPPGVSSGTTMARDRHGNSKESPLALGAPPFGRILAVCPRVDDRLLVFVIDEKGLPQAQAPLTLAAEPGSLSAPTAVEHGLYEARFSVADSVAAASSSRLVATLAGEGSSECAAKTPRVLPDTMAVKLDRAVYVAGSGLPVEVSIELAYPAHRLPRDVAIELVTALGKVGTVQKLDPAHHQVKWQLPDSFARHTEAVIEARVGASLVARAAVVLAPGRLARLEVVAGERSLLADGRSTTQLSIRGFDGHGNPIATPQVEIAARGRVSAPSAGEDGSTRAAYTAPVSYAASSDIVVVTGGDTSAEVLIELRPRQRRFEAAAHLGYLGNFGKVSAPLLLASATKRLPVAKERVVVGVAAGFYSSSSTQLRADGSESVDVRVTALPVLARASYEHRLGQLVPYAGLALGLIYASTTIESERAGENNAREPRFAAGGFVGAKRRLGPGSAALELGYLHATSGLDTVSGNIAGLHFTLGYGIGF